MVLFYGRLRQSAIKIESAGTQNHKFRRSDFDVRFRESFHRSL